MSKVVLTGANGYIGSHVVFELLKHFRAEEITAVDFGNERISPAVNFIKHDILGDSENPDLYQKLGSPQICIHLAWQDGFNHSSEKHIDNLSAHYHFLKNMADSGCRSISVMGTMHEVGYFEGCIDESTPCNPLSFYGIAKNTLRQMLFTYTENKPINIKWLRAFYITGDDARNKSVFSKITQMAEEGRETFPFTDGKNKYDFIEVNTLAKQIVQASIQDKVNGVINVCSGIPVSLKEKVEEFIRKHGYKIKPEYGVFPSRKYDSPAIWGNADKINNILEM